MEVVESDTLAERLKRGPIPVDESLEIAKQIADALEAAHDRGIIHRDLKPANIKLAADGRVKVLDFGLGWRSSRKRFLDSTGNGVRRQQVATNGRQTPLLSRRLEKNSGKKPNIHDNAITRHWTPGAPTGRPARDK